MPEQDVLDAFGAATMAAMRSGACDAEEINAGYCDLWAERVVAQLEPEHDIEMWATEDDEDTPFHVFIKIDDRYYDAECWDGVDRVEDLPFFQRAIADGYAEFTIEPW